MPQTTLYSTMLARRDAEQAVNLARFFKTGKGQYGAGDKFLGIKVPVTRSVVKTLWRETDFPELEKCVVSPYHEIRLAALLTLVQIFKHAQDSARRKECVDFYLAHTDHINNWDLVDLSCYEILGVWLLDKDRKILYDFAKTAERENALWKPRIAIVSTMQFIRHNDFADTLALAEMLLPHPHDLIHKAVGWLLREVGKRDKALLTEFLTAHYPALPRTTLRYAIERFPQAERDNWLKFKGK